MARVRERKGMFLPSFLPSRTAFLLTGLAAGVLFAPRSGRATRSIIIQKYQYWMSQIAEKFDRMARLFQNQSNRLQGMAYEMQEAYQPTEDFIDDAVLPQRIKSELGRFFNVSDLDISCRDGIVTLRGGIGNDQEKQNMIELAKRVKGVREIVSMLY
jgi:osmotically-inducible protein OsmY